MFAILFYLYIYKHYNKYAFLIAWFDYNMSNIVKSLNNKSGQICFLSPLYLVSIIYTLIVKLVYNHAKAANKQYSF
jgi:hypothetical protein